VTAEIIPLFEEPAAEDLAVACNYCGSVFFALLATGEVECSNPDCQHRPNSITWFTEGDDSQDPPMAS